jgi:hypothetical protein
MAIVSKLLHDAKNVEKIASVWFREGLKHRLDWMRCVEYVGDEFFSIHLKAKVRPAIGHLTEVQGESADRNEVCLSHDDFSFSRAAASSRFRSTRLRQTKQ